MGGLLGVIFFRLSYLASPCSADFYYRHPLAFASLSLCLGQGRHWKFHSWSLRGTKVDGFWSFLCSTVGVCQSNHSGFYRSPLGVAFGRLISRYLVYGIEGDGFSDGALFLDFCST